MSENIALRARWLIPLDSPPIPHGVLVARGGRIVELGTKSSSSKVLDAGDVALVPAFVNAHTHLEFSSLAQPLGSPVLPLTDWIRQVVAWRIERDRNCDTNDPRQENSRRHAMRVGLAECMRTGTSALGEIATSTDALDALLAAPLSGVAFLELIGLSESRVGPLLQAARDYIAPLPTAKHFALSRFVRGLSPHAPYTVNPKLLSTLTELARSERIPLAMHLAETEPELELLRYRTGPFVDLLESLNAWEPDAISYGSRPLDYLRVLSGGHKVLVIHGNYLDEEEITFLGSNRNRMSLVYCPRTHAYFGHRPYPLDQLMTAGVQVVLGTDSRASNPDLSMWEELRFACLRHPRTNPQVLLQAATLDAAHALGLGNDVGSLRAGKLANFLTVPLPSGQLSDPWSFLASSGGPSAVYVHGSKLQDPGHGAAKAPFEACFRQEQ
jgi:cytosine/adenosine deaminase-related metal-dependent hydrolase